MTRGMPAMVQKMADWDGGVPERWASWFPGRGVEEAGRVAGVLADEEQAQARVREAVLAFDANRGDGAVLSLGIWVPDPTTGEAVAAMRLELLAGEPGRATTVAGVFEAQRRQPRVRGIKMFHHDAAPAEVNAGDAVIVTRTYAPRKTGQVVTSVEWTVVPPDCQDGLLLIMSTPYAAMAEAMADQSVIIVNLLTVTLEPA